MFYQIIGWLFLLLLSGGIAIGSLMGAYGCLILGNKRDGLIPLLVGLGMGAVCITVFFHAPLALSYTG